MAGSGIPGVSLALAKNNELLCTRGYGRASLVGNVVVEPTMPATVMSVMKPITVTAALTFRSRQEAASQRPRIQSPSTVPAARTGPMANPAQYNIEVRQLMSHTAGLFNVVENSE